MIYFDENDVFSRFFLHHTFECTAGCSSRFEGLLHHDSREPGFEENHRQYQGNRGDLMMGVPLLYEKMVADFPRDQ